ncbi:hypothetical protein DNTS_032996, partial [Danionella cerebrum]
MCPDTHIPEQCGVADSGAAICRISSGFCVHVSACFCFPVERYIPAALHNFNDLSGSVSLAWVGDGTG